MITGKLTTSTAEFASWIGQSLAAHGWSRTTAPAVHGQTQTSTWRFKGSDGKPWKATLRLDGNDAARTMSVTALVARE